MLDPNARLTCKPKHSRSTPPDLKSPAPLGGAQTVARCATDLAIAGVYQSTARTNEEAPAGVYIGDEYRRLHLITGK